MTGGLRRVHACEIRTDTRLDAPKCARPSVERREDNGLWVCGRHRLFGQTFTPDPGTDTRPRGPKRRRPEPDSLLGHPVMVMNPRTHEVWIGQGVALSVEPVILIEDERGNRFMLPLSWARPRHE